MSADAEVVPLGRYAVAAKRVLALPDTWVRVNGFDAPAAARRFADDVRRGAFEGFARLPVDVSVRGCDVFARVESSAVAS